MSNATATATHNGSNHDATDDTAAATAAGERIVAGLRYRAQQQQLQAERQKQEDEIVRTGEVFSPETGAVTELRILEASTQERRWPHIESGYFDDWRKLAKAAMSVEKAIGWYFVPAEINPSLLARRRTTDQSPQATPISTGRSHLHSRPPSAMLQTSEDGTPMGCLGAHSVAKNFPALVFSFSGLLPVQRRPQDYADFNSKVERGVLRQMGRWGKLLAGVGIIGESACCLKSWMRNIGLYRVILRCFPFKLIALASPAALHAATQGRRKLTRGVFYRSGQRKAALRVSPLHRA